MKRFTFVLIIGGGLAGCAATGPVKPTVSAPDEATGQRPVARPAVLTQAPKPPKNARTVEQFDTTTREERKEAAVAVSAPSASLGKTLASLGDPTEPGFWMKTPLVSSERAGRVVYAGNSAEVTLIPLDGPAGGGSQLSLAAMRLIGAPLTDLPEVEVLGL